MITLSFFGALGTPVNFFERVGGELERIGTKTTEAGVLTVMPNVVAWRCERLVRRFVAVTVGPDGREGSARYDVRTPSCRTRFTLDAPRRVKRGKVGRIRIVDRWNNGDIDVQLCVRPRAGDTGATTCGSPAPSPS